LVENAEGKDEVAVIEDVDPTVELTSQDNEIMKVCKFEIKP
jgi:hypothetical protein